MSLGTVASAYVKPAGGGAWTPASLSLLGWWDASNAGSITSSSGVVSQWNDLSGNARHFTATGTAQPGTGTTTQNSLNVLTFDGSTDYITADAGSDVIDINPVTIYLVGKQNTSGTLFQGIFTTRVSASGNDESSPNAILLMGGFQVWDYFVAGTSITGHDGGTTWHLVHLRFDGTNGSLKLDGGTAQSAAWTTPPNLVRYLRMGARLQSGTPPTTSSFCSMHIGEVIVASNTDDTNAYTYLAAKWGLSVTIP